MCISLTYLMKVQPEGPCTSLIHFLIRFLLGTHFLLPSVHAPGKCSSALLPIAWRLARRFNYIVSDADVIPRRSRHKSYSLVLSKYRRHGQEHGKSPLIPFPSMSANSWGQSHIRQIFKSSLRSTVSEKHVQALRPARATKALRAPCTSIDGIGGIRKHDVS